MSFFLKLIINLSFWLDNTYIFVHKDPPFFVLMIRLNVIPTVTERCFYFIFLVLIRFSD